MTVHCTAGTALGLLVLTGSLCVAQDKASLGQYGDFVRNATSSYWKNRETALQQLSELPSNDRTVIRALLAALDGNVLPEERGKRSNGVTSHLHHQIATHLVIRGADALDQIVKDIQESPPRGRLLAAQALWFCTEIQNPSQPRPEWSIDIMQLRQAAPGRDILDRAMIESRLQSIRDAFAIIARDLEEKSKRVRYSPFVTRSELREVDDLAIANFDLARVFAWLAPEDDKAVVAMINSMDAINILGFNTMGYASSPDEQEQNRQRQWANIRLVHETLSDIPATRRLVQSLLDKQNEGTFEQIKGIRALSLLKRAGSNLSVEALARLRDLVVLDPESPVRSYALEALNHWDASQSVVLLCCSLVNDNDFGVRKKALQILVEADTTLDQVAPLLAQRLQDKKEAKEIRVLAAKAIGKTGAPVQSTLLDALGDSDDDVAEEVGKALKNVGPTDEAVSKLSEYVQQPRPELCIRAAGLLQLAGKEAKPALDALIEVYHRNTQREDVQRAVRSAILAIGDPTDPGVKTVAFAAFKADNAMLNEEDRKAILRVAEKDPDAVGLFIEAVKQSKDGPLRQAAMESLGNLGPKAANAIDVLVEVLLKESDTNLRVSAARALGEIGRDTGAPVRHLMRVLEQKPLNLNVCEAAVEAIGHMDSKAKDAVPFLIRTLYFGPYTEAMDGEIRVEAAAQRALVNIGDDTLRALELALNDSTLVNQRPRIALVLGSFKSRAWTAVPALTETLENNSDPAVRGAAAKALGNIAEDLQETERSLSQADFQMLCTHLRHTQAVMESIGSELPDAVSFRTDFLADIKRVKLAAGYVNARAGQRYTLRGSLAAVAILMFSAIAALLFLLLLMAPLWRLHFEQFLPDWFVYSHRVLDAWVAQYACLVRETRLDLIPTMRQHRHYIPVPAELDSEGPFTRLEIRDLQPKMQEKPSLWLISGDGGTGKSSLACALVRAGLAKKTQDRLRPHLMLPLFVENQLASQSCPTPFLAAARGALRALIGEDPSDNLLRHLLLSQRLLVVVDQFSELPEWERALLRPGEDGFPANAVIITSRFVEELDNSVARHVVRLGVLPQAELKGFMSQYLQRREPGSLPAVLEGAAARLCQIVGNRSPTALMATMYVDLILASEEGKSIQNLPEMIVAFLQQRCLRAAAKVDPGATLRDARIVAWECLRDGFRPGTARSDDVLRALGGADSRRRLDLLKSPDISLVQEFNQSEVRFTLDPVAEYLAAFYLVDELSDNKDRWLELLAAVDKQPGAPKTIRSFWRALHDCCSAHVGESVPPSIKAEVASRVGSQPVQADLVSAPRHDAVLPHDLDIRVSVDEGRGRLHFVLSSPNGSVPYHDQPMGQKILPGTIEVEQYVSQLWAELDSLAAGRDMAGAPLAPGDVCERLAALGRRLYADLLSEEMKSDYANWRTQARTVLITSDEPWIPWELLKPYDCRPNRESFEDTFLCERFRLTRWLKGETTPAGKIVVTRLACFAVGSPPGEHPLNGTERERLALARLAQARRVEDHSPIASSLQKFKELCRLDDLGLWHFAGHGDFDDRALADALVRLSDGALMASALTGEVSDSIREARPLVFFNACRTGRLGWSLARLRGWAQTWVMECRCGAFVGPMWAVDDEAACTFAEGFYQALWEGKTIDVAVAVARAKVRDILPGNPAWLAYSVYSLPNAQVQFGPWHASSQKLLVEEPQVAR